MHLADLAKTGDLPRVLIFLREPFNDKTGAGITISNLFRDWPADRLASLYWHDVATDSGACKHYYRVNDAIRWAFPLNWLLSKSRTTSRDRRNSGTSGRIGAWTRGLWNRYVTTVGGVDLLFRVELTRRLRKFLEEFGPDVIYSVVSDLPSIRLTRLLQKTMSSRLIVHIYDDFAGSRLGGGLLDSVCRKRLESELTALFGCATKRLAICEEMAEEYKRRYGFEFETFHNCPSAVDWELNSVRADYGQFVFRFFGAVYREGNLAGLKRFASIVEKMAGTPNPVFEIVTTEDACGEFAPEFEEFDRSRIRPLPTSIENLKQLYASAGALMIVLDPRETHSGFLRLSFPTKLPAYILSGKPFVVFAPSDSAVVAFTERLNLGCVVASELDDCEVRARLEAIASSDECLRLRARRAKAFGRREVCGEVVRPRFVKLVRDAAFG